MLSVTYKPFMLSVIMLNVIMLSVIMQGVIMLSVIMLSVIMLSVVAPFLKLLSTFYNSWHVTEGATTFNRMTLTIMPSPIFVGVMILFSAMSF
jgi:hypothetical protein